MSEIKITIDGNTPSKKNSRNIFVKNGRIINIPSPKYNTWHESALWQLKTQQVPKLEPNYKIQVVFYFKDNRSRDLDNSLASICDVLQDAEIIKGDNWQNLNEIHIFAGGIDKKRPRAEIEIVSNLPKLEFDTIKKTEPR